jgi:hypothetical protein
MLVWTPRRLPAGLAGRVARLPGVQRMVVVVNGTAWLTASFSARGRPVTRPPRGMAVPVDVTGADPAAYAAVAAPAQRAAFARLGAGTALLGAASARLRRLGAGGSLRFGSRRLRVAGVVPDSSAGFAEVFVTTAQAARLGIRVRRYLLLTVSPGSDARALARRVRAVVPAGTPVRIRLPGRAAWLREGDAVLPPVLEKDYFGEFATRRLPGNRLIMDPAWRAARLRTERVPLLGAITCNTAMFAPLRAALRQLVRRGLSHLVSPREYGGCYAPRLIPGDPGPAAQAVHHPAARPRAAGHRPNPAMGARGTAAHPDRGGDRRPRRLQRRDPDEDRGVPGHQITRRARPVRVLHPRPHPGLPRLPGMDRRPGEPLPGRAGRHRQSHVLIALGMNAVHAGHKVRYFTAADLTDTLYRGLADNSVGKVIENLLHNDLILVDEVGFAPLDDTGAQLLFRFVSAAYERRSLGIGSHWPFESWGRFLPEHTTAVSLLDWLLHHANVVVTAGDSYRMRQARARGGATLTKK